jgi:hypothetical protein
MALKTGFLQQMWRITIVPLLADSCYTPRLLLWGRCQPVSGCSLGVNFGDVNNWNRPIADLYD